VIHALRLHAVFASLGLHANPASNLNVTGFRSLPPTSIEVWALRSTYLASPLVAAVPIDSHFDLRRKIEDKMCLILAAEWFELAHTLLEELKTRHSGWTEK
jgi:hypothetical protein